MKRTRLTAKKAWNPTRKPMKRGSGFKTRTPLKATKPMNRVGKVGRANLAANKKIRVIAEKDGLDYCEIGRLNMPELKGTECLGSFTLASAHRHKRAWYKGDAELLADKDQWVKACVNCHNGIEFDADLTDEVFNRLRN